MHDFPNVAALLAALLLTCTHAAPAAEPVVGIARGISLLPGQLQAGQSPDGNSVIIRADDGIVVIDTGRGGAHTQELIDTVSESGKPLVAVINTHWHLDHIGGNARLRERWPALRIYAHPSLDTALGGFHADYRKQLESYLPGLPEGSAERTRYQAEMDLLQLDRKLAETDPLRESATLRLAGRSLDVHVSPHAVTEGDLWVFDPATRTLIAGDLVTLPVPMFDSACPEGWSRALATLSDTGFAQLIPGHGKPMKPPAFETYRKAFDRLLSCSAGPDKKPACIDGWFADVRSLVSPAEEAYGRTLLDYYIDQFIEPEAPGRKRWCGRTD